MRRLTVRRLRALLAYEPATGVFVRRESSRGSSRTRFVGKAAGGVGVNGYIYIEVDGSRYLAHRLAWLYVIGAWPSEQIDHINRDKLDNRWSNLREASHGENIVNSKLRCDNTCGFKGVRRNHKRWMAECAGVYLGTFNTPESAHAVYLAAAREKYGEFARAV